MALDGDRLDVHYEVRPAAQGSRVSASVEVSRGSGLLGRMLAHAADALLAAGTLDSAINRIGSQLEPALAA